MRGKGEGSLFPYRGCWRAQITDHGRRRVYTIHADTRSEAEAQLRKILQQRDDHTLPVDQTTTLAQWMTWWVEHANLRPHVRDGYRSAIRAHVTSSWLGAVRLVELEPEHLERYYGEMIDGRASTKVIRVPVDDPHPDPRRKHPKTRAKRIPRPVSARTVHALHANIRAALNVAVRRHRISRNPAQEAVLPPQEPRKLETLTETQAQSILAAAARLGPQAAARWTLGLVFGLRPGETLGLATGDVYPDHLEIRQQTQEVTGHGTIVVPFTKTDAGIRNIPIPDTIAALLRRAITTTHAARLEAGPAWKTPHTLDGHPVDLVFQRPGGGAIGHSQDTKQWRTLLAETGIPATRRYVARHTAASLMFAMGMDAATIASILGHKRASFTIDTYVHPLEAEKRQAAEAMAQRLLG